MQILRFRIKPDISLLSQRGPVEVLFVSHTDVGSKSEYKTNIWLHLFCLECAFVNGEKWKSARNIYLMKKLLNEY